MKKIILLLVLVLPVIVTVLIYMVAGFIVREMNVPFLTSIERNNTALNAQRIIFAKGAASDFEIMSRTVLGDGTVLADGMAVNDRIRLNNYIIPNPSRVPFSTLSFEVFYGTHYHQPNDALRIDWYGEHAYLVAVRSFTDSDRQGFGVEVRIFGTGSNPLGTIFVADII